MRNIVTSTKRSQVLALCITTLMMGIAFGQAENNGSVRSEIIVPLVQEVVVDENKAELGKKLWFDPRLSKSGFISCNSCHNLSMGLLLGINGKKDRSTLQQFSTLV